MMMNGNMSERQDECVDGIAALRLSIADADGKGEVGGGRSRHGMSRFDRGTRGGRG